MKKLLFLLIMVLPIIANAKDINPKYLKGGVPEENGIITFRKSFSVPGKTYQDVFQAMYTYIQDSIVGKAIEGPRTRIISDGKENGTIVARVEEYMLLKKKRAFSLDRTRFRYQLSTVIKDNKVEMTINQISYYYNEDMDGEKGITFKGEEWISDKEAINKSGTKLYPRSGKFRIKTIDRVENIFKNAMSVFIKEEKVIIRQTGVIEENN